MWFRKKTMVFVFGVTNRYTEYQRKLLNGFYPYVSNIFLFQFYFETIDFKKIGDIITIKFPN